MTSGVLRNRRGGSTLSSTPFHSTAGRSLGSQCCRLAGGFGASTIRASRKISKAFSGVAAVLARKSDTGFACDAGNLTSLAKLVRHPYAVPSIIREAMGDRGLQAGQNRFALRALVEQYESLFGRVVRGRRR